MRMSISAAVLAAICCAAAQPAGAIVVTTNGDFETGSFAGWTVGSTQVNPFQAALNDGKNVQIVNSTSGAPAWYLRNQSANYFGTGPNLATPISNYSAFNGFDGSGGNYTLQQGFTIGAPLQSATLDFDWAVQSTYSGSVRTFGVNILDALNSPLTNVFLYVQPYNQTIWTPTTTSLDITTTLNSLGVGSYQLQFLIDIPQNFTGPAQFAIDNIALDLTDEPPVTTPEPASVVVWSLLGLSLAGTHLWRRRRTRRWAW